MKEITRYPGYFITETGEVFNSKGEQRPVYLSGIPQYKYVNMPDRSESGLRNGGWQLKRVHILVAETYVPNPDKLPMVDHKDRNKLNNHKDNLQWATRSMNNRNTERAVYVEWEGERLMLVELIDKLYGVQNLHYNYIWNRLDKGDSVEVAVSKNDKYREKLAAKS